MGSAALGRDIPLTETFSAVHQEGIQYMSSGRRIVDNKTEEEDYTVAWDVLSRDRTGASNAFLVTAETIGDVIKATQLLFDGLRAADKPVSSYGVNSKSHWLAVYLGSGSSSPSKWKVERVTVDGTTIRLIYRHPQNTGGTEDIVRYYYWVPLGPLDDGAYTVELYDADLKAVTLMRRVEVKRR